MKIKSWPLMTLLAMLLTACDSGSSNQSLSSPNIPSSQSAPISPSIAAPAPSIRAPAPTPSIPSPAPAPSIPAPAPTPSIPTPPPVETFPTVQRIPIHYNLLLGQPHVWNETGGINSLNLASHAYAGSNGLNLSSANGLVQWQLITYRGENGEFYTAQIRSITNNYIQLNAPLQQNVAVGVNVWNFYDDGSHPNWAGSNAIADHSIRQLGFGGLNQGKHVLFGDSWFSRQFIFQRLQQRLPNANISNKGVGGNTGYDLLSRFEADVSWQIPNYVWIMTGTNDYWGDISAANYKSNMRQLINRVRDIGATPIVYDSSVGPLNFGSDWKTVLSRSYVTSLDQLLAEF